MAQENIHQKPIIGISTTSRFVNELERDVLSSYYARAVSQAGGLAWLLSVQTPPDDLPAIVAHLDGVVLTGGEDIEPHYYGQERKLYLQETHMQRDAFELALYAACREQGIPVLAICRGNQLVNVAHGGTLYQDIGFEYDKTIQHQQKGLTAQQRATRIHDVDFERDTKLSPIYPSTYRVNSLHHQAIDKLGEGLRVIARAPDGTVEAIEGTGKAWLVGVQWHPEAFAGENNPDTELFHAHVQACARKH